MTRGQEAVLDIRAGAGLNPIIGTEFHDYKAQRLNFRSPAAPYWIGLHR
jgi:hypothetical protein